MSAARTGSCEPHSLNSPPPLTTHCCLIRVVSNECHNGVIALDLPVDAPVDELVASVCQSLVFIPIWAIYTNRSVIGYPKRFIIGWTIRYDILSLILKEDGNARIVPVFP